MTNDAEIQKALQELKERFNYSEEEWQMWLDDPKNLSIIQRYAEYGRYQLVAEVTKSRGCALGHKVGDRLIFSPLGGFVGKEPAGEVCAGAIAPLLYNVNSVFASIAGGVDPQKLMLFNHVRCLDVGVENGGWGEVVMELKLEEVA